MLCKASKDHLKRLSAKYLSQWSIRPLLSLKPLMLLMLPVLPVLPMLPMLPMLLKPLNPLRPVKLLENSQLLHLLKSIELNNTFGKKSSSIILHSLLVTYVKLAFNHFESSTTP